MGVRRRRWVRIVSGSILVAIAACAAVFAVGGYFEHRPFASHWPDRRLPRYPLGVVYWSGDMGIRLGYGRLIIERFRAEGIPVLSVSSPMLFGRSRDRAFVDRIVQSSVTAALARLKVERVAIVASSFGSDIVGSGLGTVGPDIRQRISSVVLIVPGEDVYFHANPSGIFYRGPVAADPEHTIPLLRGLPVTCIFGAGEDDSLCRAPVMKGARRVPIDGSHMMVFSHAALADAVDSAVLRPPAAMR